MRPAFACSAAVLLTVLVALGSWSSILGVPGTTLNDQALSLVRGTDPGKNENGNQSCDEINAGSGLAYAQCTASGPFPASDTCVSCWDQPVAYLADPTGNPEVRLSDDGFYGCMGKKFVGTCVPASPFEGGQAECDLPQMPTGSCSGELKKFKFQSGSPPGPGGGAS